MATKLPGETYRGNALHVPLSADGQIALYVWPLRILSIRGAGCGGPTLGVEAGNEEVLRFDCHDTPGGHWHGGGYDRLATPRASHRDFPAEVQGRVPCLSADPCDRMLVAHGLACRMPLGPVDRRLRTHHRVIATADMRSVTRPHVAGRRDP